MSVFIYRLQDTDDRPKPGVKVQEIPFCGAKIGSWFDVVKLILVSWLCPGSFADVMKLCVFYKNVSFVGSRHPASQLNRRATKHRFLVSWDLCRPSQSFRYFLKRRWLVRTDQQPARWVSEGDRVWMYYIIDVVRVRQTGMVITTNTGFVYQDRPDTPCFATHNISHHTGWDLRLNTPPHCRMMTKHF